MTIRNGKSETVRCTVTSDGFRLAGGGCGGGPRLTDEADEMDEPDVDPLSVLGFHGVLEGAISVEGVLLKPPGWPPPPDEF